MVVPAFSDLGKSAKDVLRSGYHYGHGLFKLGLKSKVGSSMEMSGDMAVNADASKTSGNMESKYKTTEYGSVSQKWSTDGTLTTAYAVDENLMEGLDLSAALSYNPANSAKSVRLNTKLRNEKFHVTCSLANLFDSNVTAVGTAVMRVKEFLLGFQLGYDTNRGEITKNDIALAFAPRSDIGVHLRCTSIPNEYGLSVSYKVNYEWDTAIDGIFASAGDEQRWTVGAGVRYKLDADSALRLKFNKDLQLASSFQQKIHENITIAMSFNIDCANVTKGGHKIGLAANVEV